MKWTMTGARPFSPISPMAPADAARVEALAPAKHSSARRLLAGRARTSAGEPVLFLRAAAHHLALFRADRRGRRATPIRGGMQRRSLAFTIAAFIAGVCITLAANLSLSRYGDSSNDCRRGVKARRWRISPPAALQPAQRPRLFRKPRRTCPAPSNRRSSFSRALKAEGLELVRGEVRGTAERPRRIVSISPMQPARPSCSASPRPKLPASRGCAKPRRRFVQFGLLARRRRAFMRSRRPSKARRLIALARRIHAASRRQKP